MHLNQRFKTQLRGQEVDVEMEVTFGEGGMSVLEATFHSGGPIEKLTRSELAYLCREAAKAVRLTNAN
jgi:hypothetical protein